MRVGGGKEWGTASGSPGTGGRRICDPQTLFRTDGGAMGQVLRGEIRPALKEKERWERLLDSECQIRTSWLRKQIKGQKDMLIRKNKASTSLAIPYDKENPFPIPALFCFAEIRIISDRSYVVIAFDEAERPVFP